MENSLIFKIYGNSPNTKMLDFLLGFPKNEFTVSDIIEELGNVQDYFLQVFWWSDKCWNGKDQPRNNKAKIIQHQSSPIVQNVRKNIDFVSEKIADKESMKIKPIELKSIELEGIQEHIQYLQRLQRQTKSAIKKLIKIWIWSSGDSFCLLWYNIWWTIVKNKPRYSAAVLCPVPYNVASCL